MAQPLTIAQIKKIKNAQIRAAVETVSGQTIVISVSPDELIQQMEESEYGSVPVHYDPTTGIYYIQS